MPLQFCVLKFAVPGEAACKCVWCGYCGVEVPGQCASAILCSLICGTRCEAACKRVWCGCCGVEVPGQCASAILCPQICGTRRACLQFCVGVVCIFYGVDGWVRVWGVGARGVDGRVCGSRCVVVWVSSCT